MNARMRVDISKFEIDRTDQFQIAESANAHFLFNDITNQISKLQQIYDLSIERTDNGRFFDVDTWLTKTVKVRRLREKYFSCGLFADPVWDILLDLTIARKKDMKISVSSLCIAASVPTTTALRKIKDMIADGLIYKEPDKNDKRRTYITICDHTYEQMLAYIYESSKICSTEFSGIKNSISSKTSN